MKRLRNALDNEAGFAALIISIILVIVISLVTVGFAQLMRREQRAALDRQLSNAAYYAAESGINDGAQAVRAGYIKAKTKCDTSDVDHTMSGHEYLENQSLDTGTNTKYTCLLINPNPSTLEYSSVPTNGVTTAVVTGVNPAGNDTPIDTLVFSWQDASNGQVFTPAGSYNAAGNSWLPPAANWTNGGGITGILRASITPVSGSFDRSSLENSTYTGFLYPEPGPIRSINAVAASASPYAGHTGTSSGEVINGKCNTGNLPRYCSAAVDLSGLGQSTFLLHLSSFYNDTRVTITPFNGGSAIAMKGAQILIDSTGKAQDVLKRIQVRLPARNSFDYPEFDIATVNNVCKQLSVYPQNQATGTPGAATSSCGL